MNKKTTRIVLIMLGIFGLSLLLGLITGKDGVAAVAIIGFFVAIILFFIGLGIVIFSDAKEVAEGLMIGSLLIGIIGFGVCTSVFKV